MLRFQRQNSRQDVNHAASYNNGGRNTRKTNSGSRCTCGMPGMNAIVSPPSTSRMGWAMRSFGLSKVSERNREKQADDEEEVVVQHGSGRYQRSTGWSRPRLLRTAKVGLRVFVRCWLVCSDRER